MALRFLPNPIFVPLMVICALGLFRYAISIRHLENIYIVRGYFVLGVGGLYIAADRIIVDFMENIEQYRGFSLIIIVVLVLVSMSMIVIGGFKKFKHNTSKKTQLIVIVSFMLSLIILLIIIWLYLLYRN